MALYSVDSVILLNDVRDVLADFGVEFLNRDFKLTGGSPYTHYTCFLTEWDNPLEDYTFPDNREVIQLSHENSSILIKQYNCVPSLDNGTIIQIPEDKLYDSEFMSLVATYLKEVTKV